VLIKALIIAAGRGKRINENKDEQSSIPKPLIRLNGKFLIEHVIDSIKSAGITEFFIVVGFKSEEIKKRLGNGSNYNIKITYIQNDEWQKPLGLSVLKAKPHIKGDFLLSMSDHLFEPSLVKEFLKTEKNPDECILCVDKKLDKIFDMDDACKVLLKDNKIINTSKEIKDFNAVDCGLFLCSPSIFEALDECQEQGNYLISHAELLLAKKGLMLAYDIKNHYWLDIDTSASFREAERILK